MPSRSQEHLLDVLRRTLGTIMHLSMRGAWRFGREHGISMTQMIVLRQLYHHQKSCNISAISETLGITNAAVSQLLDRLVQQGLVLRREDPEDRRSKRIVLSEAGENLLKESMRSQQAWMHTLSERLTAEEAEQIATALFLLSEKLAGLD